MNCHIIIVILFILQSGVSYGSFVSSRGFVSSHGGAGSSSSSLDPAPPWDDTVPKAVVDTVSVNIKAGNFFYLISKNKGKLEIKMQMKNAYGFESEPGTTVQRADVERVNDYLKNSIDDIVSFQNLTCTYTFDEIKKNYYKKKGHATGFIKAKYKIKCDKSLRHHDVQFNFASFNDITQIKVKIRNSQTTRRTLVGNQGVVNIE